VRPMVTTIHYTSSVREREKKAALYDMQPGWMEDRHYVKTKLHF